MSYRDRITIEPGKRGGRPCIRSMRITIYDVLGWLASGMTEKESHPVALAVDSPWGTRYSVDGSIDTPSGREPRPQVRTVWILEAGSDQPRLITAHPV